MVDIVDRATRSRMMAGIRGKDTKPEMALRRTLHALGLRYRLHVSTLPGRPDIVFPRQRAAIQIHGCFWHRHEGCDFATKPSSNTAFWQKKFNRTVERDKQNEKFLRQLGWRVAIVWECAIKERDSDLIAQEILKWLASGRLSKVIPARLSGARRRRLEPR
jgi:DNA mismatch endonuclease (patch repair protein)